MLRPDVPLQSGESVVVDAGVPPSSWLLLDVCTLGIIEVRRRTLRYVVTDRRVIYQAGPPGGRTVRAVPLDKVQDVSVQQVGWVGRVVLSTAGETGTLVLKGMRYRDAQRFAAAVDEQSAIVRDERPQSTSPSP